MTALVSNVVEVQHEVADVEWRPNGNAKLELIRMFLVEYKSEQRQAGTKCTNVER